MTINITLPSQVKIKVEGTDLEIVEYVASGLLNQGFKRATKETLSQKEACTFFSQKEGKTLRCAVGQFVPDMETFNALCVYRGGSGEKVWPEFIECSNIKILDKLQALHDGSRIPQVMAGRLYDLLISLGTKKFTLLDACSNFMNTPLK